MIIDKDMLVKIAQSVNEPGRKAARVEDDKRFKMFHGSTEEIIKEAIAREYTEPETVNELSGRLIPINLFKPIIIKQAGVYVQGPIRSVINQNTSDTELMEDYVDAMCLDQRMKEANRYFKMFKRNLMEVYVDEYGYPYVRNLPRHSYEVFSFSSVTPNRPDVVVKIIHDDKMFDDQVFSVWSDSSHWVIDGRGQIKADDMAGMNNLEGVNPYQKLPFVYINESSHCVDPIPEDDLMRMSIAIPLILTDISWATKYMSNSILWTVGFAGKISTAPNSQTNLQFGPNGERPEINQIKPEVDTDKVISMVQTLVALLLSTKSLSVNTVQTTLDASNAASGIAKMLDNAESVEDKKDQQEYFEKAEKTLWRLLRDNLIPAWRAQQNITSELNREFSKDFEVDVMFMEPKVMITELEQIEISQKRMAAGFSTLEMELTHIYPQKNADQITELVFAIEDEKAKARQTQAEGIDGLPVEEVA